MDDFPGNLPGNSHTAKLKKEQQDAGEPTDSGPIPDAQKQYDEHQKQTVVDESGRVKKVISGKAVKRRKSLSTQFKQMFASEGEQSFMDYLFNDVAIPMIQETIITIASNTLDGIKNGIEDRVSGGRSERRTARTTTYGLGKPVVNYNAQYRSTTPARSTIRAQAPAPRMTIRRSNRVEDVFVESREDGMDVLEELTAKIDGFGHCTVADLYAATGVDIETTDEAWGWDSLDAAKIRRVANGAFQIVVPRPMPIQFEN